MSYTKMRFRHWGLTLITGLVSAAGAAQADIVQGDDVIIQRSLCVGFDCVNNENFGSDTIRLKENNLRIKFQDTSTGAFPTNDWQIIANDGTSGGQNKFSIQDFDTGRLLFTLEAGAPAHSLYVDDGGRLGLGTNNPAVELHVKDGDTATLRLEQDTSSGFAAQSWDVAGNETNFFIRDVTGGSRLPFRIRPGAPSNAFFISEEGDIGIGTASPDAIFDIESTEVTSAKPLFRAFQPDDTNSDNLQMLQIRNLGTGAVSFRMMTGDLPIDFRNTGSDWRINLLPSGDGGGDELILDADGNMTIDGSLTTAGPTCAGGCDAVFDPEITTVLSIEEHAALMWQNRHLPAVGPTGPGVPVNLTEKMGGILNELEHAHIYIEQLNTELKQQRAEIAALMERLDE